VGNLAKAFNSTKERLTMFGKQRLITIAMTLATLVVIKKAAPLSIRSKF
jgi:hypothetical protein